MRTSATIRIRIITGGVLCIALILIARLYQVQVLRATTYRESAEKQYVRTVRDFFNRGSIFFTTRRGEQVSAATVRPGSLLPLNPGLLRSRDGVYERINL